MAGPSWGRDRLNSLNTSGRLCRIGHGNGKTLFNPRAVP